MGTLQKHYTNNPTTENTFIIAHVAILMAREGRSEIILVNAYNHYQKYIQQQNDNKCIVIELQGCFLTVINMIF